MEYLREGLTHILDRLKVKSDLLATARMQVSTVRQATNDTILLTVHCFMVGQEDRWNYPIEISVLDIAQTAGDQGGLVRLLESRAVQALEALDRVAREYVEILEFVQKSDREEPAPEIPKSVPYDIVRGAAELPERDPWISRRYIWEGQRRVTTREALESIFDAYSAPVADNVSPNNPLLRMLRRQRQDEQDMRSATEIAIMERMSSIEPVNQDYAELEIRVFSHAAIITGLDFGTEYMPGDVVQSEGRLYRAVRTGISGQEFAGVYDYDQEPSRAPRSEKPTPRLPTT